MSLERLWRVGKSLGGYGGWEKSSERLCRDRGFEGARNEIQGSCFRGRFGKSRGRSAGSLKGFGALSFWEEGSRIGADLRRRCGLWWWQRRSGRGRRCGVREVSGGLVRACVDSGVFGWAEARGGFWAKGGAQLLGKGRGTTYGQREGHESLSIAVAGASITTSPIEDGTRLLICTRRVRPTRSSRRSSRAGCSWSEWEELERGRLVGTGTCWS
ncbi:hypothetical protein ACFE04_020872 [Oxalis oulophora]